MCSIAPTAAQPRDSLLANESSRDAEAASSGPSNRFPGFTDFMASRSEFQSVAPTQPGGGRCYGILPFTPQTRRHHAMRLTKPEETAEILRPKKDVDRNNNQTFIALIDAGLYNNPASGAVSFPSTSSSKMTYQSGFFGFIVNAADRIAGQYFGQTLYINASAVSLSAHQVRSAWVIASTLLLNEALNGIVASNILKIDDWLIAPTFLWQFMRYALAVGAGATLVSVASKWFFGGAFHFKRQHADHRRDMGYFENNHDFQLLGSTPEPLRHRLEINETQTKESGFSSNLGRLPFSLGFGLVANNQQDCYYRTTMPENELASLLSAHTPWKAHTRPMLVACKLLKKDASAIKPLPSLGIGEELEQRTQHETNGHFMLGAGLYCWGGLSWVKHRQALTRACPSDATQSFVEQQSSFADVYLPYLYSPLGPEVDCGGGQLLNMRQLYSMPHPRAIQPGSYWQPPKRYHDIAWLHQYFLNQLNNQLPAGNQLHYADLNSLMEWRGGAGVHWGLLPKGLLPTSWRSALSLHQAQARELTLEYNLLDDDRQQVRQTITHTRSHTRMAFWRGEFNQHLSWQCHDRWPLLDAPNHPNLWQYGEKQIEGLTLSVTFSLSRCDSSRYCQLLKQLNHWFDLPMDSLPSFPLTPKAREISISYCFDENALLTLPEKWQQDLSSLDLPTWLRTNPRLPTNNAAAAREQMALWMQQFGITAFSALLKLYRLGPESLKINGSAEVYQTALEKAQRLQCQWLPSQVAANTNPLALRQQATSTYQTLLTARHELGYDQLLGAEQKQALDDRLIYYLSSAKEWSDRLRPPASDAL